MPNVLRLLRDNAKASARKPMRAEANGEEATIYLYDVIVTDDYWGGVSAEAFVRELNAITASTIHLRINSPGGEVFAARCMEAAIKGHPAKVIAHVDGYAASAASFVAIACDDVLMAPGAFMMIHKAWVFTAGNSDDLIQTASLLKKLDGTLAETYSQKCGKSVSDMAEMMAAETWFTAQEAVEAGLADSIEESAPKAQANWNLGVYAKAPVVDDNVLDADTDDTPDSCERDHYERIARFHEVTA